MNDAIIVAIITVSGSLVVAAITFYLTKKHELAVQWRNEKLNHYKVLLSSLSDLTSAEKDKDAYRNFSLAVNTISLVAPQYVVSALMACYDQFKSINKNGSQENHDKLLKKLILAIRKDIGLSKGDNEVTFDFHLIAVAPK